MSNYLMIFTLSLMLMSCAEHETPSLGSAQNGDSTNSGEGQTQEAGQEAVGEAPPSHWISSVPFQRIEAGSFTMGSPEGEPAVPLDSDSGSYYGNEVQVSVTISKPFEIMKHEVTQSQWVRVMGSNPSGFKRAEDCEDHIDGMCPNNPVEMVSWDNVQEFITKLNDSLGLTSCNDGGITGDSSSGCYRLPTEAEWEYVSRAGTTTAYFFGDDASDLGDYAWYQVNSGGNANSAGKTYPVGTKKPNPWGLYDMYGNVLEWVQDNYVNNLPGGIDPLHKSGSSGSSRVIRGGEWGVRIGLNNEADLRSAKRQGYRPASRFYTIGFRLVRTL